MARDRSCDLLIAGRGAAGYAAALYAARYRLNTALVGAAFGGETATAGQVENYPGVPDVDGFDLMLRFAEQVEHYPLELIEQDVVSLERDGGSFLSLLADGSAVHSVAVVLAVGRARRTLGLTHEREWTGRGVSYCSTCDAPLSSGRVVAVIGGGNSAAEGALLNAWYADHVYLLVRGAGLDRADPIERERVIAEPRIEIVLETEVIELLGDEGGLTAVRLNRPLHQHDVLEVGSLFIEIGAEPRNGLARQLGAAVDVRTGEVVVDECMRTNAPGLFAAGDLTTGSGGLKQTVTAAAQGAVAASSAYDFLSRHPAGRVDGTRPVSSGGD